MFLKDGFCWSQNKAAAPTNMLSSLLCCPVGYVGLTSRDRLNRSENYLPLGFLLVIPSQSVHLLFRQSVTLDNCSILVSYPSSSKVKCWKNAMTLETQIPLVKRVELGQETIQSKNFFLAIFSELWRPAKKRKSTNKHQIFNLTAAVFRFSQLLSASRRINTSLEVIPGKKPMFNRAFFLTLYWGLSSRISRLS